MDQFSEFPNYDAARDTHKLRARLEDFFLNEYLITSERDKRILYDSDGVPGTNCPNGPGGGGGSEDDPTSDVTVGIFDAIIAIPQAAVNLHFHTCWESARTKPTTWNSFLTKWTYSNIFEAEFEPITVRLLSNEHAIVLIHIDNGRLNSVGKTGRVDPEYAAPFSATSRTQGTDVKL